MDIATPFRPLLASCLAFATTLGFASGASPTSNPVATLDGSPEDSATTITHADLLAASGAADGDGDPISFRFKSLLGGELKTSGGGNVAVNDTLSSGQSWVWTPDSDDSGLLQAIRVRAYDGSAESAGNTNVFVGVTEVNDEPSFTKGSNVSVAEDSGTYVEANWATDLEEGAANESGQTLSFQVVSNNNTGLFAVQPTVNSSGTLSFTPVANGFGTATVGIRIRDDGGIANSGDDSSPTQTFVIEVTAVNDPPSFVSGGDVTVDEDSGSAAAAWATAIRAGPSNESGQTLTFELSRTSGDSDLFSSGPSINSATGVLSYTLAAHQNGSATFDVTLRDGPSGGADTESVTGSFTIEVDPVPDRPVLGGSFVTALTDSVVSGGDLAEAYGIFDNVTLVDVDDDEPSRAAQTVTVTIDEEADDYGTFVLPDGGTPVVAGGVWTYTFAAADVDAALASLGEASYQPDANARPVGVSVNFDVSIAVADGTPLLATPLDGTITISSVNDPPVIDARVVVESIADDQTANPFSLNITDPDVGDSFSVEITRTGGVGGTLTGNTGISGDAAAVFDAVRNIVFEPAQETGTAEFRVSVTDSSGGSPVTADLEVEVVAINDVPSIAGVATSLLRMTDDPGGDPMYPFAGVTIADADPGEQLVVTLSLDDPEKGGFVGEFETGTFNLTGTASEVTDKLRAIVFQPTPGRLAVGESETVRITIRVSDGTAGRTNDETRVEVTAVDGAPAILWDDGAFPLSTSPAFIDPAPEALPFEKVTLREDGEIVLTVTLDESSKGELTNLGGFTETEEGSRSYSFSGTSVDVQAALRALVFEPNPAYRFPAGEPGRTDFTLVASDAALNSTTRVLPIVLISDARNFLVTSPLDPVLMPATETLAAEEPQPGTLRHALAHARDNDVITFALPSYPATIRLSAPLLIERHLHFRGPGSDKLTISGDANANDTTDSGDVRLFEVYASLRLSGLRLERGFAANGGAVAVARSQPDVPAGSLRIEDCVVADCVASQWGGAVDVTEGSIEVERCLFENNSLLASSGLGGGAIALFTHAPSSIVNTTFSGNRQEAASGYGGGAVYVENDEPTVLFPVHVTHCTFADNQDAADLGSSLRSNVSNTRLILTNSIFADSSARNLYVGGGGQMVSEGGNLSSDNTSTTLLQGGVPQLVVILDDDSDQRNIDPQLDALGRLDGPTRGRQLLPGSPAIGAAVATETGTDQRGVVRNGSADSGALDFDAFGKLVVNEILAPPGDVDPGFIEFYNPRDQVALSIEDYELYVDGRLCHVFGDVTVSPGFGVIVSDGALTGVDAATPVIAPNEEPLGLDPRGLVELRAPSPTLEKATSLVASMPFVGVISNPNDPAGPPSDYSGQSLTLAPQFQGQALVPHALVLPPDGGVDPAGPGDPVSPGADTGGRDFGAPNAPAIANPDRFEADENQLASLDVLFNDLDADGDALRIVDVNTASSATPPAGSKFTVNSAGGATVTVTPAGTPLQGTQIDYDPRIGFDYLPEGARVSDTFAYTILDFGGGPVMGYADGGAGSTRILAPAHRLAGGEQIAIGDAGPAVYNDRFVVTVVDDDHFTIPVDYAEVGDPALYGRWVALATWATGERDEGSVEVIVLGKNDPPTPLADLVVVGEETVARIFSDADHAGSAPGLDTDGLYPAPRLAAPAGLLENDSDPDSDDEGSDLHVVGVCLPNMVGGYSGTSGESPVTVSAAGHGLANGDMVLIANYGGHPSYNGNHPVTVTSADEFTIPVTFVDNDADKGLWTILNDSNRLATTSALGAAVALEIRADRSLTNVVYNPRPSMELDGLADGEQANDTFHYAVEDRHGAVSLAAVSVQVNGVNDAPQPGDDPSGLAVLTSGVLGGLGVDEFLEASEILYLTATPGQEGRFDVTLLGPGAEDSAATTLAGVDRTDEDTPLALATVDLLANDEDIDRTDTLAIELGASDLSREGATISLSPDGMTLGYDPTSADGIQALAAEERIIDTFVVRVTDGIDAVDVLVAVLVEGRNDRPQASDIVLATDERTLIDLPAPGLILNGLEIDQNVRLPDDRRFVMPVEERETTVAGALAGTGLVRQEGIIDGVNLDPSDAGVTVLSSTAHGLNSGQEVVLLELGPLTGQYQVTRIDADRFSVPVAYDVAFAADAGGLWTSLAGSFLYDPRGSVFAGPTDDTFFTLQGLGEGQTFVDRLNYTLIDGSHLFANDDIYRIEADRTSIELRVLDNDTSLDGVATSHRIVEVGSPGSGGSAVLNGDQSILYTPQTGFVGDELFTYTIEDDLGNRDRATVTARVTVDRLNGNLRANDDVFTVAAGESPLLEVLSNDSVIPATGDPLTLVSVGPGNEDGALVIEGGAIRYTPKSGFVGEEFFTYTISGGGSVTAVANVRVLVVDRTDTLNVRDDAFGVAAGAADATLNVLENDNVLPGNGADLSVVAVSDPANGELTIGTDGAFLRYTPDSGFLGEDSFTYTAADGFGGTGTASVTVEVGFITTNSDIFAVPFDSSSSSDDDGQTELDVLANDAVVLGGGGELTIIDVMPATSSLGTIERSSGDGSLLFDPAEDATGQQDFTYTVADGGGRTSSATVTVVVVGNGVRASSDFFTVRTDSSGNPLDVLSNDLRISENPGNLSISAVGTGTDAPDQGGLVEIGPDFRTLLYTPPAGFSGTESFTYVVTDGDTSDTARVSVRSSFGEMVAGDDDYLIFRGSAENRLEVLGNDRVIPDGGQLLRITAIGDDADNVSNPAFRGTLEVIEEGVALSYTPSPDNTADSYEETFTYEISAGGTARAQGRIRLQVINRVSARELETNADVFSVRADSTGTPLPVLDNDGVLPATSEDWQIQSVTTPSANLCSPFLVSDFTDPAGLAAELAAQSDPLTLFLWSRFDPASQALLADPNASDQDLTAVLVVEFNAVVAAGSSIYSPTRFNGVTLRPETQALLDEGVSGEQLIVLNRLLLEDALPEFIEPATGAGAVQLSGNALIYTPQPGFVGTARFTYQVSDGLGGGGSAEVIVRVGDVSVSDDLFTVLAGAGPVDLPVTANDGVLQVAFPGEADPAQADFSLSTVRPLVVDPSTAGTAVVAGESVSFTPDAGFIGEAVLTYWVEDDAGCAFPGTARIDVRSPEGDRDTAEISIVVRGVNDAPQLLGAGPGSVNDTMTVNPFAAASVFEPDDQMQQQVTLVVRYSEAHGLLTGDFIRLGPGVLQFVGTAEEITAALRALVFTPTLNRIVGGTTEDTLFAVTLDDGVVDAPVEVDDAVVTVTPVNDPPVLTGTVGDQDLYQAATLRPFAGVDIRDVDEFGLQPQTVTVAIDDAAKGVLINLGGFVEQSAGSGQYVFVGTPAAASSAIRNLVFQPTGGRALPETPEVAVFTVSIEDGFAAPLVDTDTSVIIRHGEVDRLLPLDETGGDISQSGADFAAAVAIDADTVVVGSPMRAGEAVEAGRAYVYERHAGLGAPWGQVAELIGSDSVGGDRFGFSVAVSGDRMVIGAPGADPGIINIGAAYVFERDAGDPNAWNEVAKLLPPVNNGPGVGNDAFGTAVAIDGDTILVGAPNGNLPGAPRSGRVFVFGPDAGGWSHLQTLIATENLASGLVGDSEGFGHAIDLEGDTAAIGAPGANRSADLNEVNFGAAYIFTRPDSAGSWSELLRIDDFNDTDGEPYAGFGYDVDLSGDRLAVGVYSGGAPNGGFREGRARVYGRDTGGMDTWGLLQKFEPEEDARSTHFGHAVGLSGDLLIVGSPGPNDGVSDPRGSAVVYRNVNGQVPAWSAIDAFMPGDSPANNRFGDAIAFDGFTAVIGAKSEGVNAVDAPLAGGARVYQFQYDLGPRLAQPLADRVASQDEAFTWTLPDELFVDPVYGDELTIDVRLSGGAPLPAAGWLKFDSVTGILSGTPTAGERRNYELQVSATNPLGTRMISSPFRVDVAEVMPEDCEEAYEAWANGQFTSELLADAGREATDWGMSANPDGDPYSNLFEFMFGGSANTPEADLIEFRRISATQMSLSFPLADAFPEDCLQIEWSNGLSNWQTDGVVLSFEPRGAGTRTVTAIVTRSGGSETGFMRISIGEP